MAWHTILTTSAGEPLSELAGADARNIAIPLRSLATAGATVRLDHDDADTLLECDTNLKVLEDLNDDDAQAATDRGLAVNDAGQVLHFHGRQVTAEEDAGENGGTVAATWADSFWTLMRRLVGKSAAGYSRGDAINRVDPATVIIPELVAAANAEDPTGLRIGTVAASTPTYVAGWRYKPIGQGIAELTAVLDGPEWRVRPIDAIPTVGALAIIGELDVAPALGTVQPDSVFEHGDGLTNVRGYKRTITLDGTINRAYHLPDGFPESSMQAVLEESDAASRARRGLLEDVVAVALTPDELRRALLRQVIAVRANPRQTITLDPVRDVGRRVPKFGVDFSVGDVVPFRASIDRTDDAGEPYKARRIDALQRVYQFAATLDKSGAANPSVTVNPS